MYHHMKKISVLLFLIVSLGVLSACGNNDNANNTNSTSSDGEVYKLKMANQVDEQNFQNQGYVKFKEILEEKSDGRFEVEIYNGGTLVSSDEETVDALNSGTLELATVSAYGTANTTGVDGLKLFDFPMFFKDRDELYQIADNELGDQLREQVAENSNVTALGFVDMGFYGILNSKKDARSPEDFKGLKIRSSTADLHLETLEAMGANPTPMAYPEIFTGLQQGTIDGVTTSTALIYGDRFYEVAEHMTLTNHVFLPHLMLVNNDFYNGLPEDLKEIFDESAQEYIEHARNLTIEAEEEAIQGMKDAGIEVIELTDEEREAFVKAVEPVIEKHIDTVGKDVYEQALEQLGK
ncbi:MAG TPA: TRAP transporter substrate-binding protein [Candidatus Pseudogracilibacillus intestinigallinarum]|uniref:TRAP transporter substrate-binding protein n=1 Tax=Candidatus Pseudogracilibacillus intestinigallinarum TaxID=2838742 RepID=A0A9D1TIL1_9BACI|nr:TRAP transporter substrate-binding protein [Candidatus Pseudogracilibacillus intestinigallinarum]